MGHFTRAPGQIPLFGRKVWMQLWLDLRHVCPLGLWKFCPMNTLRFWVGMRPRNLIGSLHTSPRSNTAFQSKYECSCGWTCATYVHLVFGSSVPWTHCAFEWGCDPEILLRRYESSYVLNFDQRGQQPLDKGAPVQCYLWDGAPIADTTLFESSFLIYEYNVIKSLMGRKLESRILAQRFPRKHFLVLCNDFPQKLESARFA